MEIKIKKGVLPLVLFRLFFGHSIQLVGQLLLSEVFALFLMPFLNFKSLFKHKIIVNILAGFGLLLLSQILSDLVNNTPVQDYLRGWAVIVFSAISTVFLTSYFKDSKDNLIIFLTIGFLMQFFFGEGELDIGLQSENTNYFKIRFVFMLNTAIMLLSYFLLKFKMKLTVLLIHLTYSLVCFYFDARSNGLGYMVATIILFFKYTHVKMRFNQVLIILLPLVFISYIAYINYANKVLYSDFGGSNAQVQMSAMKNPYNPFELLVVGRSEVFVSLVAIKDKPIFGHGSWAKDKTGKYANIRAEITSKEKITRTGLIPSHSILIGAYLNAGILGFLSMLYIYFILSKIIFASIKNTNTVLLPLLLAVVTKFYWDMLFSPFGLLRISLPGQIAIIIGYYYTQYKNPKELLTKILLHNETSNNNTSKN